MSKEKQIEEMAQDLCPLYEEYKSCKTCDAVLDIGEKPCVYKCMAELITTKGYRKQSEGEWEKFEGERFICSNCAKVFGLGSTATIHDVKRVWKYCPNCGAKMKGGAE